jgi:hypothetical protein
LAKYHTELLLIGCTAWFDNKRRHFTTSAKIMVLQKQKKLTKDRCTEQLAAHFLYGRPLPIHSAVARGNGNMFLSRWRQN